MLWALVWRCTIRLISHRCSFIFFFFFNDTATTEIYTLSLHDALPISRPVVPRMSWTAWAIEDCMRDRKSTRLNSSHVAISYAVFCLKKKKEHYRKILHKNKNTQTYPDNTPPQHP